MTTEREALERAEREALQRCLDIDSNHPDLPARRAEHVRALERLADAGSTEARAALDDGPCPECHNHNAHEGVCYGTMQRSHAPAPPGAQEWLREIIRHFVGVCTVRIEARNGLPRSSLWLCEFVGVVAHRLALPPEESQALLAVLTDSTPKAFAEGVANATARRDAINRAYVAASVEAFQKTLPEDESVTVEDLDDDTLAALNAEACAHVNIEAAEKAGAAAASRLYLHRTGNPALPHTCRTLLKLRSAPLQAIATLVARHNTDESFTSDAEQVLEQIERIVDEPDTDSVRRGDHMRDEAKDPRH
jgi:hypothetical protein